MLSYTPEHRETAFLLGGIGTGSVSLGARGELRDWELFNRPGKGISLPCTFFCLRVAGPRQKPLVRLLEARIRPPYSGPNGWRTGINEFPGEMGGVPRFADARLTVNWPFAELDLLDDALPVAVSLEAFSPFVPLDSQLSATPCAIFSYTVCNRSDRPLQVSLAATLLNSVGFDGAAVSAAAFAGNRSVMREEQGLSGLFFDKPGQSDQTLTYGSLALMTDQPATCKPEWVKGAWWDGVQEFWDDFIADGKLQAARSRGVGSSLQAPDLTIGSLALSRDLEPGQAHTFRIALAWYFPNRLRGWWATGDDLPVVRNEYANRFQSAWDAGRSVLAEYTAIWKRCDQVRRAFRCLTMPPDLLHAALRNLTVLRSQTCFRLADGTFMGWEGCLDHQGSCHGTCTHVYNYAQSAAFLFPDLERSCRNVEFGQETDTNGAMAFRSQTPFGWPRSEAEPAIDGQFGTLVRLARDWRLGGGDDWLRRIWPQARKALDFGLEHWDPDGDGLAEARQHNTFDIEFYGANPLGTSMLLAALTAGIAMARRLGDHAAAVRWQERLDKGKRQMEQALFNGRYYIQMSADRADYRYQPGRGCLSDQLTGQFLADCAGLGDLLDPAQLQDALTSIVRFNFRHNMADEIALHRTYALNDEPALLLCTWPDGDRPEMPMPYADESWTGVTYAVAAQLLRRGHVTLARTLVSSVNGQHDGICRNPFNEAECGHHYARSMASWALVPAWTGAEVDLPNRRVAFHPVFQHDGRAFFSCGLAWGLLCRDQGRWTLHLLEGRLDNIQVSCDGQPVEVVHGWPPGIST
ncbi:MAG: hypothetical protein GX821_03550 [Clostridiaceae bacterium]|nr:GH116 family glycosyl-hydrolase [Eubacteriales bacterium]MDD4744600.1 GH116 family glycosyl-hydrolase [Eubacteriales bacterium]NLB44223.1 hypothetical protein [Clostridiaceae bacterium]